LNWQPTWPVYVPELYAGVPLCAGDSFSTVMSWDAYGEVVWEGETYGQKSREIHHVRDLPKLAGVPCAMALAGGSEEDRAAIAQGGWELISANTVTKTRQNYLAFMAQSRGELSICKNGYAKSRSGWFSDRTLAYMALGRPAVVQDTGLSEHLPTGLGLHLFSSADEALEGLRRIQADYARESAAATALAREFFGAERLLHDLLQRAGVV
jgi:hypothetical protein